MKGVEEGEDKVTFCDLAPGHEYAIIGHPYRDRDDVSARHYFQVTNSPQKGQSISIIVNQNIIY